MENKEQPPSPANDAKAETETPETDAHTFEATIGDSTMRYTTVKVVHVDRAMLLERRALAAEAREKQTWKERNTCSRLADEAQEKLRLATERLEALEKQHSMDTIRFREMQDSGLGLEIELKNATERVRALEAVVTMAAVTDINGYDFSTLLEKIKQLTVEHGGIQNAYALSHAVLVHNMAVTLLSTPATAIGGDEV